MAIQFWTGGAGTTAFSDADNWSGTTGPGAGDDCYFIAQYPLPCTGSDSVEYGALVVEDGYTGALDLSQSYTSVDYSGSGVSTLFLRDAAITVEIKQTASGGAGTKGLYISGTALTGINVYNGSVGVGYRALDGKHGLPIAAGTTVSVGEIRIIEGDLKAAGIVDLTTCYNFGAEIVLECDATTVHVKNGTTTLLGSAAATTVDCLRGEFVLDSSGTIASLFIDTDGSFSASAGDDKTITALSFAPGANLSWYPSNMTIGTFTLPSDPVAIRSDGI